MWGNKRNIFNSTDLEAIITSNQNGFLANDNTKSALANKVNHPVEIALKAESLCKTYDGNHLAAKDVSFSVKMGEVKMDN